MTTGLTIMLTTKETGIALKSEKTLGKGDGVKIKKRQMDD